jgi:hypothetical protein
MNFSHSLFLGEYSLHRSQPTGDFLNASGYDPAPIQALGDICPYVQFPALYSPPQ